MTNSESEPQHEFAPYPFTEQELQVDKLMPGVLYTLEQFYGWRDNNLTVIDDYLRTCGEQLKIAISDFGPKASFERRVRPSVRNAFEQKQLMRELEIFSIRNMAMIPDQEKLERFIEQILPHIKSAEKVVNQKSDLSEVLKDQFSIHKKNSDIKDVAELLYGLYLILPEEIIQGGAMGKIARTMLGVSVIASYDLLDVDSDEKKDASRKLSMARVYMVRYMP
jgi:hypothetical protein